MTFISRLRQLSLRVFILVFATLVFALGAKAAEAKFDIPAGSARDSLQLFIQQSGTHVLFGADDVKDIQTNAVSGTFDPSAALTALLKGTVLSFKQQKAGWFVIVKADKQTGSVEGTLYAPPGSGKSVEGVIVEVAETGEETKVDEHGRFSFAALAPGGYTLVARGNGFSRLRITDVVVVSGHSVTLGGQTMPIVMKDGEVQMMAEVQVHAGKDVETLPSYVVEDTSVKPEPFSERDVDLPRGIDDVQPYYIFNSQTIEQSGSTDVEDFLKQRLTMDTTIQTNSQNYDPLSGVAQGNTSSINLRGLGTAETLILVDGRPMAGVASSTGGSAATVYGQPDINGIPLAAIDRIEVLPSSASGIYGGSAIGGVINIILKKEYNGGEIKATWEATGDGRAPIRTLEAAFGTSLDRGKMQLLITAQYSDSKPLYFGDRLNVFNNGYSQITRNDPTFFLDGTSDSPPMGSAVNIGSDNGSNLTLKSNGASLNSPIATLPVGYAFTSLNALGLAAIPGQWNLTNPDVNASPNGLRAPLGNFPQTKALFASLTRHLSDRIDIFSEFSYSTNRTLSNYNQLLTSGGLYIPSTAPNNPFNQAIDVSFPIELDLPWTTVSIARSITLGMKIKLPGNWNSEIDYQWSGTSFEENYDFTTDGGAEETFEESSTAIFDQTSQGLAALAPELEQLIYNRSDSTTSSLNNLAVRAAGPLFNLPWGAPQLAVALQHKKSGSPAETYLQSDPYAKENYNEQFTEYVNYGQSTSDDNAYAELDVPIVTPKNQFALARSLEFQASTRFDSETVGTGTYGYTEAITDSGTLYPNTFAYEGPVNNGSPFHGTARYDSTNDTLGFLYKPVDDLIVRASYATAFLPPTYDQLLPNPTPNTTSRITDPILKSSYTSNIITGGNANLKPQTSKDWELGIVWEPRNGFLKGLRGDLEYSKITQFNSITTPTSTLLLSDPGAFPGRVVRDPVTGKVTFLDESDLNLYERYSDFIDLSLEYKTTTAIGTFDLYAMGTMNEHDKQQVSPAKPMVDLVGYPSEGGPAKAKGNVTLTWQYRHLTLAWTTEVYGRYMQDGAKSDPLNPGGSFYILPQGSDHIPAQVYHDFFAGYAFGKVGAPSGLQADGLGNRLLSNISLQAGVKNVFNTLPAFDAYYAPFYYSPYGDIRLRDYWIALKKSF